MANVHFSSAISVFPRALDLRSNFKYSPLFSRDINSTNAKWNAGLFREVSRVSANFESGYFIHSYLLSTSVNDRNGSFRRRFLGQWNRTSRCVRFLDIHGRFAPFIRRVSDSEKRNRLGETALALSRFKLLITLQWFPAATICRTLCGRQQVFAFLKTDVPETLTFRQNRQQILTYLLKTV